MSVNMRLAAKGKGEPREGLVQQGKAHILLARHYAEALIESGWSDEDTVALEKDVAMLESMSTSQADERSANGDEAALGEAKAFLRRLRNALPRALRESTAGVNAEVFEISSALGRSTPKISEYLARIRPTLEAMDDDLAKYFGGRKATHVVDSVKSALDKAGSAQDLALASLPEATLVLYEVKGRVLQRIEDLNRAGRIAFEGQAETVGKFNKDVLLRARRHEHAQPGSMGNGEGAEQGARS